MQAILTLGDLVVALHLDRFRLPACPREPMDRACTATPCKPMV
jgi:hypothetical protein